MGVQDRSGKKNQNRSSVKIMQEKMSPSFLALQASLTEETVFFIAFAFMDSIGSVDVCLCGGH